MKWTLQDYLVEALAHILAIDKGIVVYNDDGLKHIVCKRIKNGNEYISVIDCQTLAIDLTTLNAGDIVSLDFSNYKKETVH